MIARQISASIQGLIGQYSVFTITGPRQSGKTTLIRSLFSTFPYFSLENPDTREQIRQDPRSLFARHGHRMVLDEVQRVPELLSYIQGIVDEDRSACFVLSGSHNPLMMESVNQSLAGRTAIFYLQPLSYVEIAATSSVGALSYEELIYRGGYPRIYDRQIAPERFYPDYLETYVQRDVRQLKNIGDLATFRRFMELCASQIGQTVNYSNLATAAGISLNTVKSWLSLLETSFVTYTLNPYFRNFKKRLVKSPKLYFRDTGLACSLLRLTSAEAVANYYQMGALFENLVMNEYSKLYFNRGERPPFYFWRDNSGHEINLLIDLGGRLQPLEIKAGRTYRRDFFKQLDWFQGVANVPLDKPTVIYGGDDDWTTDHGLLQSWRQIGH